METINTEDQERLDNKLCLILFNQTLYIGEVSRLKIIINNMRESINCIDKTYRYYSCINNKINCQDQSKLNIKD